MQPTNKDMPFDLPGFTYFLFMIVAIIFSVAIILNTVFSESGLSFVWVSALIFCFLMAYACYRLMNSRINKIQYDKRY